MATFAALATSVSNEKPNILFIFADDWGWGDLGCHGHPFVKTPHIDRLAKEGTDFVNFTVASGVCSPSRTAVMTGHFPARYAIDGHFAWVPSNAKRGMPDWLDVSAPSMPRFLQQAGYRTGHFGKWHLANNMIPDSPTPAAYGYDEYGAFNCSGEQMPVHEDAMHTNAFIEKAVEEGKPFFVNLWIHEPHTPFHTVPKYEWRFRHLENEADRIYASVLSHADDRIGEVLDTLDRLGVADNTLVIFSSDNGPARGAANAELKLGYDTATGAGWMIGGAKGITAGRRGYKASLFQGGINVPFIARWPGKIAAGESSEALISAVDLLPTFCEIAGAKLPQSYRSDGLSVLDVLKGKEMPRREKPLFWKFPSPWPAKKSKPDHWVSYVAMQDRWKLVTNNDGSYIELYDIMDDVYEKRDLKASQAEVAKELVAMLEAWKAELPDGPSGDVFSELRQE
ncbi:MAG: sulfatase-like hydrolase/transferase [Verrucomicrobiota bacterium]